MCGIAGLLTESAGACLKAVVVDMTNTMALRGPDGSGVWIDPDNGVALGQRRLAVVDLSKSGSQPMASSCGRFTVTYNGEIYNADELRAELRSLGKPFQGHSDTEVIVQGFAAWGIHQTLARLVGMFALGVWDGRKKQLTLIRDRLGIKPLYWSLQAGTLIFASELKALAACPAFDRTLNRNAVVSYLRYNYIPAPQTIYVAANKLEAGWMLEMAAGGVPRLTQFWALEDVARHGQANRLTCSDKDAIDQLEALLSDAVARRMIADVPLGAFLSGGIDSSTVAALMQKHASKPVKTFSIGFESSDYNEAQHAAAVAKHLGTDHTELYLAPQEAQAIIPKLASIYDEPFADSSQIPIYMISRLTRGNVTVALSGDGGDELFAGYNRYIQAGLFTKRLALVPRALRELAAAGLRSLTPADWDAICARLPGLSRHERAGDKIHKLAGVLGQDANGFYRTLVSHWENPQMLVPGGRELHHSLWCKAPDIVSDTIERMQFLDTMTYLPDDILTKLDRASMAVSLEARVPMLDHRLVEFAWQLPMHLKLRGGKGKWILRQVLYRHVPEALIDRPKMGFGVPLEDWLRGSLKEWAESLLATDALNKFGLVDPAAVTKKWNEHQTGKRNWQHMIWSVLMLQAWCEEWA